MYDQMFNPHIAPANGNMYGMNQSNAPAGGSTYGGLAGAPLGAVGGYSGDPQFQPAQREVCDINKRHITLKQSRDLCIHDLFVWYPRNRT